VPVRRQVATQTDGNLAVEPDWRVEVSSKLRQYRARRSGVSAELQTVLPFETDAQRHPEPASESANELPRLILPEPERSALQKIYRENVPVEKPEKKDRAPRKILSERFELELPQLDLSPAYEVASTVALVAIVKGPAHTDLHPVASLPERRLAALVDLVLLLFTYGGMLALFTVLGGRVGLNKLDVTVTLATLALFYAQYFALFTVFGGSTPGMMVQDLRVIGFNGETPTSRQMAMRSLGYLISAGGCFLGFIWALWDEDRLCWQDRISHTYLTPNVGDTGS
jgi:uncharacterized RDD family membrane protein YckC